MVKQKQGNNDKMNMSSNALFLNRSSRDNVMIYPNGLLMAKVLKLKPGEDPKEAQPLSYIKHYYIGSERVSAKTGTMDWLGYYPVYCLQNEMPHLNIAVQDSSASRFSNAATQVLDIHQLLSSSLPALNTTDNFTVIHDETHDFKKLDIYYFHPDHLGSSSYITNMQGMVSQHMEYLPFGELLVDEHKNSYNSPFKYNGKEFDEETGNYFYGARYYDPKWSIFISVDPLAGNAPAWTPYNAMWNNPIRFVDPDGRWAVDHIDVTKNDDGTYNVVDGQANSDKNIYVVDGGGKRTGEVVGQMLTEYSFHHEDGSAVKGTNINLNDQSGQNFFNDEIKNIGLVDYISNAKGKEPLDFKHRRMDDRNENITVSQHHYRGMSFNGKVASARDIGNYSAGYVAGKYGFGWGASRFAFDALETKQAKGTWNTILYYPFNRVREGQPTQQAERAGHNVGYPIFKQRQAEREWKKVTNPWPIGPKY